MDKEPTFVHPDGGYGWVIVAAIIFINIAKNHYLTVEERRLILGGFLISATDVFTEPFIRILWTLRRIGILCALLCALVLRAISVVPFLKKYSMRLVAFVGATLMCLGIFLSSFANSYIYLIVSVSILIGLGQGILMPATYLAQYTYFKKRLTIAVSLCVTGASLSPIIVPKLCDILLTKIGRSGTLLVLSGFSLLGLLACLFLKPVPAQNKTDEDQKLSSSESKKEENFYDAKNEEVAQTKELISLSSNDVYQSTVIVVKQDTIWMKLINVFDLQLLKDGPFVMVIVGLAISFAAELNIILMIQFILNGYAKLDRSQVATTASIQAVADIVGRLVVPLIAHACQVPSKVMYGGALLVACIGRTVLAVYPHSLPLVFTSVALLGITKGCRAVFQSVIIPKYVPLNKVATATGLNMLLTGAVSLIIGPIIGAVSDKTSSPANALHAASLISLFCVFMWIFESLFCKPKLSDKSETTVVSEGNNT